MDLKDIVQLAFASTFTDSAIAYFDTKVKEHKHVLLEAFPNIRFKPKHHFVEHYPELIRRYGPLVQCTAHYDLKVNIRTSRL